MPPGRVAMLTSVFLEVRSRLPTVHHQVRLLFGHPKRMETTLQQPHTRALFAGGLNDRNIRAGVAGETRRYTM